VVVVAAGAALSVREVVAIWAVTLSTGADMIAEVWVVDEHEWRSNV
jgi:hypothetical protein